ncbi:MAG: hypothetical protein BM485_10195 [Desulfobulbaceae bacterium DB1]|nr:MAG: hypothetical protein BM485_10195 [Desulfobulbaceae bacterium DB1]
MKIDWFTFAAQIINFLILVWLLKKVLYKPVVQAMQKREDTIAARLDEAQNRSAEAQAEKEKYQELQQKLHDSVPREMRRAREEADNFRNELIESVRLEVEKSRSQWHAAVEQEKETFLLETSRLVTKYFHQLAGKALRDLANEDLEQRILSVFSRELDKIPAAENEKISHDLVKLGMPVIVTSAFPFSPETREELKKRLDALWGAPAQKEFVIDPALLAGIQVEAGGKKIKWDMRGYLREFEKKLAASLERANAG